MLRKVKNVDSVEFASVIIARESNLNLELSRFQILNVAFENKSALVQKCKLIAGVLKFAKRM